MTEAATVTVEVGLGDRAYDILIGPGLLARSGAEIARRLPGTRAAIVTDENVAAAHLDTLKAGLAGAGIDSVDIVLPPGEKTKSFDHLQEVVDGVLAARLERRDCVIALGGGVIGDLAGFAAGIVRRGMRFVQMPTSLLAQVDSSVGGKTGINSSHGKNLVGVFHQPQLVLADTAVLDTLPEREFRAGYAEVAKYGLIDRPDFFAWLDQYRCAGRARRAPLARRSPPLAGTRPLWSPRRARTTASAPCSISAIPLRWKPKPATDPAARWRSPSACGSGALSARLGRAPAADGERLAALLERLGLPVALPPGFDAERLLARMRLDKKNRSGHLRLILWSRLGRADIVEGIGADAMRALLVEAGAG